MSSGIISGSLCWRIEVGGDPGVPPGIGKERGDLGKFAHLVVRRELGKWLPFRSVVLEVVYIAP